MNMANEKQNLAFFRYVSGAKKRGDEWTQILADVNAQDLLGSRYSLSGIRALYGRMKRRNLKGSLCGLSSIEVLNQIKTLRLNGARWEDVGIELGKQGLINKATGIPYSSAGIQDIFARMNGGKKQFPPKGVDKTNATPKQPVPLKASEIDFQIAPSELSVQDLMELLAKAINKEQAERSLLPKEDETRAFRAMRILKTVPALEDLSIEQLEKINKVVPMILSI
jgi:hypothetical protein